MKLLISIEDASNIIFFVFIPIQCSLQQDSGFNVIIKGRLSNFITTIMFGLCESAVTFGIHFKFVATFRECVSIPSCEWQSEVFPNLTD